ncbi:Hypothetical predicted protein, partial [Paramuricea clavata]
TKYKFRFRKKIFKDFRRSYIVVSSVCSLQRIYDGSQRTQLDIDDILRLLEFVLSNSYFIYNDVIYKQIHGCAMGSPVSAIVANLCMEVIEEQAIQSAITPPKTWKRFVDDSFAIINKNAVTSFHNTLNSIDPHIKFTIEHEKDGQIAFLDTLVSRHNNSISFNVFRKPTHTDRYLDFSSHHDLKHKISTATTLINRSLNLPTTEDSKYKELKHISETLASNGYPKPLISKVDPSETYNGHATLPYIKGVTEPLSRTLRKHNIKVHNKPLRTLQREFPSVKHRPPTEEQTNVIYKIPCKDCPWNYIGETGRSLKTRKSEHFTFIKTELLSRGHLSNRIGQTHLNMSHVLHRQLLPWLFYAAISNFFWRWKFDNESVRILKITINFKQALSGTYQWILDNIIA